MMRLLSIVMLTGCLIFQAGDLVAKGEYDSFRDESERRGYLKARYGKSSDLALKKIVKLCDRLSTNKGREFDAYGGGGLREKLRSKRHYVTSIFCKLNNIPLDNMQNPDEAWEGDLYGELSGFIKDIKKLHGIDNDKEWAINYIVKRQSTPASGMDEELLARIKAFLAEHCKIN